jgi:SET domain-containing protein
MSLVICNKVIVKTVQEKGLGAFASQNIEKGALVERGIIKRINNDGDKNPHLFSWSEDRTIWGFGSGCSTFYNTSRDPNTKMIRYFDEDRFEIFALRDIKEGEELTHLYKSLEWRTVFKDLRDIKNL